ncbi:glycosyltransferase 87 family protein [Phytoactinopolyspora mesophila]|uniref:glycosyltransferase 87 family protein n=1 Tax=Phytoactinopolyspora mesophila TaxID=2650750 RepID=UPI0013917813
MNSRTARPSRDDRLAAAASEWIGGPAGRHAGAEPMRWWGPLRVTLAVACFVLALGFIADKPCHDASWASRDDPTVWTAMCYSDVPFLYRERGFADGEIAYVDRALEYPVFTGAVMQASAYVAQTAQSVADPDPDDRRLAEGVRFYEFTALLMGIAALVVVVATARTVPRRPWDAMLVAASPVLLLSATINWDLLAVAMTSVAILAWTRERSAWAGVLIGLGAATKLYPVLLLGPMLLVAMRAPDRAAALGRLGVTAGAAVVTWLAVNIPVAMVAREGWASFFEFNADRGAEFGSIWHALEILGDTFGIAIFAGQDINRLAVGAGLILLGLIIVLAVVAPEPARLAQLAFLAVAAFVLINKVWSPQYTLWLLPLAVLAHPRWRELLVWQAAEVVYFVAVWLHLAGFYGEPIISAEIYALSIVLRVVALIWLAGFVVRDVLHPEHDPVRAYVSDPQEARPELATGRRGVR